MAYMTKISTQIYSSIPQYDIYEVWLKQIEWKVLVEWVKVNIFVHQAQQVGLDIGFLWVLVLWIS
jgi:hypothetical protein